MEGLKILVVDDEKEFASTLAERLSMRGLDVKIALGGETALEMMASDPPEVMLLDVLMPGMGGLEVLRKTRSSHPNTKVILLTGHGSTRDGMEGMRQGACDYLMKPVKIEELMAKLEEAVTGADTE